MNLSPKQIQAIKTLAEFDGDVAVNFYLEMYSIGDERFTESVEQYLYDLNNLCGISRGVLEKINTNLELPKRFRVEKRNEVIGLVVSVFENADGDAFREELAHTLAEIIRELKE